MIVENQNILPNVSSPSSPLSPVKFHQRLAQSFSIRTSISTSSLNRPTPVNNKIRRSNIGNSLHVLWKPPSPDPILVTPPNASTETPIPPTATHQIKAKRPSTSSTMKTLPLKPESSVLLKQSALYSPLARMGSSSLPTLQEFYKWTHDYLTELYQDKHNLCANKVDTGRECLDYLLKSVDHETFKGLLKDQRALDTLISKSDMTEIIKSLLHILTTLKPAIYNSVKLVDLTETPSSYTQEHSCLTTSLDWDSIWPDHLDRNTHWFHTYFCGNDYTTLLIPINKNSSSHTPLYPSMYAIVTARQEAGPLSTNSSSTDDQSTSEATQYRLIIRHPKDTTKRYLVNNTQIQNHLAKESSKTSQRSSKQQRQRSIRGYQNSTSRSSYQRQHDLMIAAISSVCPEFDIGKSIYLSSTTTRACHLEKELLHLDKIEVPPAYKFGVLTIQDDQSSEEEWFSNTGLTGAFDRFLNIIGDRIQLKGYDGYAAGLDTKTGETGDTSVVSRWNSYEIMFHVAPLMPYHHNDKQQVQRKRYIGNDIVCLVFLEGNQIFDPKAIRSKFLHVYIVIRLETFNGESRWRIEVVRKNNVPEFGPSLPNPPHFYDDATLQKFLTLKLINAENAALKCDNFSVPNNRARAGLLKNIVEKGLAQGGTPSSSISKMASEIKKRQSQSQRRPKPSANRLSRGSFRSIRSNPDNSANLEPPPPPPLPSPTRSTMLQDLKNFALRRAPTLSAFQQKSTRVKEEPPTPPDDNNSDDDDGKNKTFRYTTTHLPSIDSSFNQGGGISNNDPTIQHSILAAKANLSTTVTLDAPMPTRTTSSQVPIYPQSDGLYYKAENLMINVVGRRSNPRSTVFD